MDEKFNTQNIYTDNIIHHDVSIEPLYYNTNFKNRIYYKLKMLEGLCVAEGYVKKNSIEILDLNDNYLDVFNFTGNCIVNCKFKASICHPINNEELYCKVVSINEFGIKASVMKKKNDDNPLYILITKEHNKNEIVNLKIDDIILIKVIGKKYNLYDDQIFIIGLIVND